MSSAKTALVTGGNRGIGLEVVRQLAARGWRVFLGTRNPGAAEAIRSRLPGQVEIVGLDVASAESAAEAAREVSAKIESLDVLVNNAGVMLDGDESVLTLSEDVVRSTFEINTFGPLRVTQAFLSLLRKSTAPRIINVSSGAGQLGGGIQALAPAYSISKTALNSVTKQLAAALPDFAVNSVTPGWVKTDMGGANATRSVEQGADVIVWLTCEAAQSLTGKFLRDRQVIDW